MSSAEWKNVTVFISSTFNDMHAERDYLVKYVFPELREWGAKRKLRIHDIDLRWGITLEDSQTSRTLGICLRDIDESRPFFLGFMGQRRGWRPKPEDVDAQTRSEYPELTERMTGHTVTEMEIEHALLDPLLRVAGDEQVIHLEPARHALVFLRDDTFTDGLSPAQKRVYTNWCEAGEGEDPENSPAVLEADREMEAFRRRLEQRAAFSRHYSGVFHPEINSPELGGPETEEGRGRLTDFRVGNASLKEVVIEGLKEAILKEYPDRVRETDETDSAEVRRLFEERMAEGYIDRPEDLAALDDYIQGPSRNILVLHASSGCGKTTLLVHYCLKLRAGSSRRALLRSCGTDAETASVLGVFGSFLEELGLEKPMDLRELKENIQDILEQVAGTGSGIVLFIDALDQIPGGEDVLRFMPAILPEGVKIVVSIRSEFLTGDLSEKALVEKGMRVVCLSSFDSYSDKKTLVEAVLASRLKKLDEEGMKRLFSRKGSSNPLFLKAAVSELGVVGRFDLLQERIDQLGETPEDVFSAVLTRLEKDIRPEGDGGPAVRLLFSLLAASRYGLDAEELREIFRMAFPEIPAEEREGLIWGYLRQVRDFMVQAGTLSDIRYDALRRAARRRYADELSRAHSLIASCFLQRIMGDYSGGTSREYGEVLYHLFKAEDSTARVLLEKPEFLSAKLEKCGIRAVMEDYELAAEADFLTAKEKEDLSEISSALRNAAYILEKNPGELAGQLFLRMDRDTESRFLRRLADQTNTMWLRPVSKSRVAKGITNLFYSKNRILGLFVLKEGLLSVDQTGLAAVHSVRNGAVIRTIRGEGLPAVSAYADEKWLYLADQTGSLLCYDIRTGALAAEKKISRTALWQLTGDGSAVYASDTKSHVFRITPGTLEVQARRRFHGGITSLFADTDGLVLGGRFEKVWLCDRKSLKPVLTMKPHIGLVSAVYADKEHIFAGGYGETLACFERATGKYVQYRDFNRDDFTCLIASLDENVMRFSGFSGLVMAPSLANYGRPAGVLQSVRILTPARRAQGQVQEEGFFFAADGGLVGFAEKNMFAGKQADSSLPGGNSAPAGTLYVNPKSVLIVGEDYRIRMYDRKSRQFIVTEDMAKEEITSACAIGNSFILGQKLGQVKQLNEKGEVNDFVRYNSSINIDPDIPVYPMATDGHYIVYFRYGSLNVGDTRFGDSNEIPKVKDCQCLFCYDGLIYVAGRNSISVYRAEDREKTLEFKVPGTAGKMMIDHDILYAAFMPGTILSINPETGKILRTVFTGRFSDFLIKDGVMIVSLEDHTVRTYSFGRLVNILTLDDSPWAMGMDGRDLFIASQGGDFIEAEIENKSNPVEIKEAAPVPQPVTQEEKAPGSKIAVMASLNPAQPLKKQKWVGILHILFFAVAAAAILMGFAAIYQGTHLSEENSFGVFIKSKDSGMPIFLIIVLVLWFGFRKIESHMWSKYRKEERILFTDLLMAASAIYFMLFCRYCLLNGLEASLASIGKWFNICMSVHYLYLMAAFVLAGLKFRLRLGTADRYLEGYLNITAGSTLVIMLLKTLLVVL